MVTVGDPCARDDLLEESMNTMRNALVVSVLGAALLWVPGASAAGETDYDPAYCGGPHGTPAPSFSTLLDLPNIFLRIAEYTLSPSKLYGPGPWTNWYRERDMRKSLAKLATMRSLLEGGNLWDTYLGWTPAVAACPGNATTVRTIDGTCNDLREPFMGAAGVRFGRNMNPQHPAARTDYANLMEPNPREVSRLLFTRDELQPVPFLNMLAAAWIQFQVHDWFAHENSTSGFWEVPLSPDDPLYEQGQGTMLVARTADDPTRKPWEAAMGPTYLNEVTLWWDGSQIYGSDQATADRLRAFEGGRLAVDDRGLLPKASDGFDDTGFRRNWWVGLALMHTLFAHEHNAIADMLRAAYPQQSDQWLYDKARMINAAVIVKIHTLEWTPAILPNRSLEVGMNANWYGLNKYLRPKLVSLPSYVPLPYRHVIFGVRGGPRELHTDPGSGARVPFSLTEEFVSVYRMHPLLPDEIAISSAYDGRRLRTVPLERARDRDARRLLERHGVTDLLFSFGVSHPGALVLHNYPRLLQNLKVPVLGTLDLGAVDVLRDRERGIPRYNEFRRQLQLLPVASIDQLTSDPALRAALKEVYGHDAGAIERVDLLVGTLAEGTRPTCYGFGETAFQVFTLMATRRLHADRFYTEDYRPEVYTPEGLAWIDAATMKSVLLRHYPALGDTGLANVTNAFYPWE
jgi:hypothetical protein